MDHSDVLKVNARELENRPSEPDVNMEHIAMKARGETHQKLFKAFSQRGARGILVARVARWEVIYLEQKCQELGQMVEHTGEKQDVLAALWKAKRAC